MNVFFPPDMAALLPAPVVPALRTGATLDLSSGRDERAGDVTGELPESFAALVAPQPFALPMQSFQHDVSPSRPPGDPPSPPDSFSLDVCGEVTHARLRVAEAAFEQRISAGEIRDAASLAASAAPEPPPKVEVTTFVPSGGGPDMIAQVAASLGEAMTEHAAPAAQARPAPDAPEPVRVFRVQLEPESLGHVEIRISASGGDVRVHLRASGEDAAQRLHAGSEALLESIRALGHTVSSIVVDATAAPSGRPDTPEPRPHTAAPPPDDAPASADPRRDRTGDNSPGRQDDPRQRRQRPAGGRVLVA
jgi:hypothetical protein